MSIREFLWGVCAATLLTFPSWFVLYLLAFWFLGYDVRESRLPFYTHMGLALVGFFALVPREEPQR